MIIINTGISDNLSNSREIIANEAYRLEYLGIRKKYRYPENQLEMTPREEIELFSSHFDVRKIGHKEFVKN